MHNITLNGMHEGSKILFNCYNNTQSENNEIKFNKYDLFLSKLINVLCY